MKLPGFVGIQCDKRHVRIQRDKRCDKRSDPPSLGVHPGVQPQFVFEDLGKIIDKGIGKVL
jgi:hypothetical protein